MSMKSLLAALLLVPAPLAAAGGPGELHIVTTGDVHGSYFNRPYVGNKVPTSLMSVKHYVDSLRVAVGPENVVLLDAGDVLQGNNASYYYNYVATGEPHVWPRLAAYMGYDACTMGNHDVEAGHPVYDRVRAQLEDGFGIPWLAGNALKEDGSPAFPEYALLDKGGRKVLVLGFNNANIAGWLSPELWSGAKYVSLVPLVQNRVYYLKRKLKPDAVIVVVHSGTGAGDGRSYESQGLDIYNTLRGVDVVVTAHDHRPVAMERGLCCLVNGGSRAGFVGHAVLTFGKCGKVKTRTAEVVRMDKFAVDHEMVEKFDPEFQAVKAFTTRPVGDLEMPLRMRDAYTGMCDYIDLLHTVQLAASGADVSFAAPLTYNGYIPAGRLVFNDMFTIYPYENQLFVLKLRGREIKDLLEFSYDHWICTPGEHVLKIANVPDPRTGANKWSFVNRSYNFDSAAGISYTVDVTKPAGSRVVIESFADGSPFKMDGVYTVAMTSYRANGGGSLLTDGAGIPQSELASRVVARYPEIRNLIYDFIREHGKVGPGLTGRRSVLGAWRFVPESVVNPLMKQDMELVF